MEVLVPLQGKNEVFGHGKRTIGTLVELKGDVRFDHVDFGYDDRMILKQISLYAKPGQKIAFVGSTGAGKTTITNLINRFYDVQGGSVIYDGIDVRDIKKDALRRSLGIVLQDTHLFTGTVAENIRFGKLDATQEEIERLQRSQMPIPLSVVFHMAMIHLLRQMVPICHKVSVSFLPLRVQP